MLQSMAIAASGQVTVADATTPSPYSNGISLVVSNHLQVDGSLSLGRGSRLRVNGSSGTPGLLTVGPTGSLRLAGTSADPAVLEAAQVDVAGVFGGHDYVIDRLGSAGVRLLGTSQLSAAPDDLRNGRFVSSAFAPGAVLLDIARANPTSLANIELNGTAGVVAGVRATTPYAVDITGATGPVAGAAHEVDPLGVISWERGVSFHGVGMPGCLPLAVCGTNAGPRIGSPGFAFTCTNAQPIAGGFRILGLGGLATTTPSPLGFLYWIDPGLPSDVMYVPSAANGFITSPLPIPNLLAFVGLQVWAEFLIIEPASCATARLSSSTALRITVQP
jgi:hypothetical protein